MGTSIAHKSPAVPGVLYRWLWDKDGMNRLYTSIAYNQAALTHGDQGTLPGSPRARELPRFQKPEETEPCHTLWHVGSTNLSRSIRQQGRSQEAWSRSGCRGHGATRP